MMIVAAVGAFGIRFTYGADASVIVRGDDLLRVQAMLDTQIGNWQGAGA
jgi:hypothetical protein